MFELTAMKRLARSLDEAPRELLVGFAQVMLQPSSLVGAAFLVGVFWNSYIIALFGVVGCLAGVLTAITLNFPEEDRRNGLYGFNGALVGLGTGYFFEASLPLVILVFIGGMASSVVMYRMLCLNLRPLTFPFVVVTWGIFALLWVTGWATATSTSGSVQSGNIILDALSRGIGQVLFQENVITGIIFLLAITIRDWTQGIYTALATLLGLTGAYVVGFPVDAINLGLFGYNGVLCAILFAGRTLRDFVSAITAIVLSIGLVRLAHVVDIPPFTFPFVLSSWIVLWIRGKTMSWATSG